MLSIQSLTEIFNEFYDKFYFVRNTEVDRFNRSRFVPMIAKNIQLNYRGFNIEEIRLTLDNGIAGNYDNDYNRSKHFNLPTVTRWFQTYFKNEHLAKRKKEYNVSHHSVFKPATDKDREMGTISNWFSIWRIDTNPQLDCEIRNAPYQKQKDRNFITDLKDWQRKKLQEWMEQYRPDHELTKWMSK